MRYVVLVAMSILSVILSGSFLAGINVAGIQVNLSLLIIIALALIEKTSMPIVFAAATGLFMDILFSTVLGVYAISYTVVAAVITLAFKHSTRIHVLLLLSAGAGGYLIKEAVMAVLVYALGARFDFLQMLIRYILPSAALAAVLILLVYWLVQKLFRLSWMRPPVLHKWNEF